MPEIELKDNRLVVHHVGGRTGTQPFPTLPSFENDIVSVMYDADESCVPQMANNLKTLTSKTVILPYCLSAHDGDGTFHLNYDPYSSSIYPINPKYKEFYYPYPARNSRPAYDYVLGDTFRTMEDVQLSTITLDTLVLNRGEVPGPDFLSIDAQGSALDILSGASRLLNTSILAVHSEVELHPFYEGQPLFGDICRFLAQYNFELVDIKLYRKLFPKRGKHGFRGLGYFTDGEALFLKRPETVQKGIQLNKLAFLATIFGQFECAQDCFETTGFAPLISSHSSGANQQPRYLNFISNLADAVESLPQRSSPIFSDVYSYTQSQARFQVESPHLGSQSLIRKLVRSIRPLVLMIKSLRAVWQRLNTLRKSAMPHANWRLKRSGSAIEALFIEFNMKEQYLLAQRNRMQDSQTRQKSSQTSTTSELDNR